MTKAIVLAFFMIVLVLGMVTKETRGQEMCRDILMRGNCEASACTNLCMQKWKGTGACFQNEQVESCLCTFPCKI
ncbi:hypothetical protein EUTSA_v10006351mg [Eutrema salsugineum]|uniref:Knottin scorpion toxin-like domain-containing protein n=1 Tax=Eutrema salsugineum TaxID=72664 RepID=V4ND79_EUTSA|nr:putative defensin-like protein 119 [Eutrema salsugineum]ESQ43966.1 hypothetical protein EUTSA_v10006351mg [Eutrema salsugineum]